MKTMKRMLSLVMVLCIMFTMVLSVNAVNTSDSETNLNTESGNYSPTDEELEEIEELRTHDSKDLLGDNTTASEGHTLYREELTKKEQLRPHGLEDLLNSSSISPNATTKPYSYITLMPNDALAVMISAIDNGGMFVARDEIDGIECFKFVYDGHTVYVNPEAFFKTQKETYTLSQARVNSQLSSHLTNDDSSPVYTTRIYAENAPSGGYLWYITQLAYRGFYSEDDEIVVDVEVTASARFRVMGTVLEKYGSSTEKLKPGLSVDISNSGSKGTYFGAYQLNGLGASVSTTDISSMIDLGYSVAKLVGSIATSRLSFDTFYGIFNDSFTLLITPSGSLKDYESRIEPISNTARKEYTYSWSLESPFKLTKPRCYYQAVLTLKDKTNSSVDFDVNVNFNFD